MTSTSNPEASIADILTGTLVVLFVRGFCLGRHYSVGHTHQATGETRLSILNLQGTPVFEVSFQEGRCMILDPEYGECEGNSQDMVFETARRFARLEATLPLGVGDDVTPQYSQDHPNFPKRS